MAAPSYAALRRCDRVMLQYGALPTNYPDPDKHDSSICHVHIAVCCTDIDY